MRRLALALTLSLAVPALAIIEPTPPPVPVAPAEPSFVQQLVTQFVTPSGVASVALLALGAFGTFLHLDARRKAQIAAVTKTAYAGVENWLATMPDNEKPALTKVEQGLKIADDWCLAHGWRLPDEKEKALIKLGFDALHGQASAAAPAPSATAPVPPAP